MEISVGSAIAAIHIDQSYPSPFVRCEKEADTGWAGGLLRGEKSAAPPGNYSSLNERAARAADQPDRPESDVGLNDPMFRWFLLGWEFEIRAGHTPMAEIMEEASERFFWHFPFTFGPKTERRLVAELAVWTRQVLAREEEKEASWAQPTTNDQIASSFEALRKHGITALENVGCTIHDAWGYVGLEQRRGCVGAVFFHHLDVADALEGEELLVGFGSFDSAPEGVSKSQAIGRQAVDALHDSGIAAQWSGGAEERIRIPPFEWRKRRWTVSPAMAGVTRPTAFPSDSRRLLAVPSGLRPENLQDYVQTVVAVRSSAGYDLDLATKYKTLWRNLGGVRGQMCHFGPPHVFVPAGEQTAMIVRNAHLNLAPVEANEIRLRAVTAASSTARAPR